jgi:arginyl-tRNA synthetase
MIRGEIKDLIKQAIRQGQQEGALPDFELSEIIAERSPDAKRGDYSTNVAMKIAGLAKKLPMEAAQIIAKTAKEISQEGAIIFDKIEVARPGFINFFIGAEHLQKKIGGILKQGEDFFRVDIGQGQKVQVEFISANPTGPLTVGNSRGGVIGDVLSNVLSKAGWQTTREYYFNDAGGQIDILGHSVLKDGLAEYKGEYVEKLHDELGRGDYREIGRKAAEILIEQIKETTGKMGINFDVWFAEGKDLREKDKVDEIIEWIKEKDLAYEKEGALWFKSTLFGDDKDRVLIRSNGEPTYFAVDCAYHKNKFVDRKFDKVINIWGADHHGDAPRMRGFVKALGYEEKFDIVMHQFVGVVKDGKEVRMSKRAGNYVAVADLLEEAGKDAYRFFMLQYSADTHMDFNLDLAKERSQKNPVYYVQYAYARISSVLAKSEIRNHKFETDSKLELLNHPAEMVLIKQLIRLPEIVEDVAGDYQVQRLPQYALDLVRAFHKFYEECRVIDEKNQSLTQARLSLVEATRIVLKNTLDLMGISAPEKM